MDGGSGASSIDKLAQHGGRLSIARESFPDAPQPWVDLSTGINPHAYRALGSTASDRARLPDPQRLLALETIAGRAFGVSDARRVTATPGTELALRLLPATLSARSVAIAGPTYSSHADAWRRTGAAVSEVRLDSLDAATPHDVILIVNPNNPDGALISRDRILALHDALQVRNGWLIIDEAFVDVDPVNSICDLAGSVRAPNLIALRSFGKFYGLAGVRLGFAIGATGALDRLRGLLGEWPLSADALAAGTAAYGDDCWAQAMREQLLDETRQLDALLTQAGFTIIGGTSLFRLAQHRDAAQLVHRFLNAGILVRPFAHDSSLIRFGLPGTAAAWRKLATTLRSQ